MTGSDITMTYSAILRDKSGKKVVRVQFERDGRNGREIAEGVLPDGIIQSHNGYSDKEVKDLEDYLLNNSEEIMSKAKIISNPLKWL